MRIRVITDRPGHPLFDGLAGLLAAPAEIGFIAPDGMTDAQSEPEPAPGPDADLYLLKSKIPAALALAHRLERRGARVVNGAVATERCQDRALMAAVAHRADLPFPRTWTAQRLDRLPELSAAPDGPRFPLIVKSRMSRRSELLARLDGPADLAELAAPRARWAAEPVVVQEFAANDGWDHKIWVVGGQVFRGLRRTPLEQPAAPGEAETLPAPVPPAWAELALRTGAEFGLDVYGVDILAGPDGPLIVDVNAFPGVRGVHGGAEALAALIERHRWPAGGGPTAAQPLASV